MLTRNKLDTELEKNKNNVFMSESIKGIVNIDKDIVSKNNSLTISFSDIFCYPVLSFKKVDDKFTIYTQIDGKCLNSVILESFKTIVISIEGIEVKSFALENYLLTYKIIYNENNNYLLKIKVRRKDNGI